MTIFSKFMSIVVISTSGINITLNLREFQEILVFSDFFGGVHDGTSKTKRVQATVLHY